MVVRLPEEHTSNVGFGKLFSKHCSNKKTDYVNSSYIVNNFKTPIPSTHIQIELFNFTHNSFRKMHMVAEFLPELTTKIGTGWNFVFYMKEPYSVC